MTEFSGVPAYIPEKCASEVVRWLRDNPDPKAFKAMTLRFEI